MTTPTDTRLTLSRVMTAVESNFLGTIHGGDIMKLVDDCAGANHGTKAQIALEERRQRGERAALVGPGGRRRHGRAPLGAGANAPDTPTATAAMERRGRAAALRDGGWSNKRIAREVGVHPSTVGRWFAGAHRPVSNDGEEATR